MPELPEVETVVRAIRPDIEDRAFTSFETYWDKSILPLSVEEFRHKLIGQRVRTVQRRAKYIIIELDGLVLVVHLRMTGHLSVVSADVPRHKWDRTIFGLDDGRELRFRDLRKFGTIQLTPDLHGIVSKLGPEPLGMFFSPAVLKERLAGRKGKMKPLLLNQQFVAGIGNIYADEALFHAKIDPRRTADTLSEDEIVALHGAIRQVLKEGIEREGASISDYVKPDGKKGDMQNAVAVFRRTGAPCYACGTLIERIKLVQRSTHFCPQCQK